MTPKKLRGRPQKKRGKSESIGRHLKRKVECQKGYQISEIISLMQKRWKEIRNL